MMITGEMELCLIGIVPNWLHAYVLTNILSNLSGRDLGKIHRELEAGPP